MFNNNLPAIQKAYDLAKEILPRVAKFPKDYKFTLGERITENTLLVLENAIHAAYERDKRDSLNSADIHLERLRFLLRLSMEVGPISHKGYAHVSKLVDELGRQIGGWRKQASGK